jgi:hypothetical protein
MFQRNMDTKFYSLKSQRLSTDHMALAYNSGFQPVVCVPLWVNKNNIGNGGKHTKKRSYNKNTKIKV